LHVVVTFVLPIVVTLHALLLQSFWAALLSPVDGVNGRKPLLWEWATGTAYSAGTQLPDPNDAGGYYVVPLVQCLLWESAIFAGTSLIRLALNYLRPPLPRLMDVARHLYSFVAILHFFLFFTYIGTVSAWLVVAAALEPSRFLPYGMAVLVVLFVGGSVYHQMQDAAKRMKMLVKAAFERMMQAKLKRALKTIHERLRIAKRVAKAMEPPSGDDEEEAEEEALMQEAEGKTVSPADVFAAINVNGDDELDMA